MTFFYRNVKCVQWAVGVMTFIFLCTLALVTYSSLVYDPPFKTDGDRAKITRSEDGQYYFQYWRQLSISEDTAGRVSRYIAHTPSGKTIELGMSEQVYKKANKRPVYRLFPMGWDVEKGEWCISATLSYRPQFSIRDHQYVAPMVCANVE